MRSFSLISYYHIELFRHVFSSDWNDPKKFFFGLAGFTPCTLKLLKALFGMIITKPIVDQITCKFWTFTLPEQDWSCVNLKNLKQSTSQPLCRAQRLHPDALASALIPVATVSDFPFPELCIWHIRIRNLSECTAIIEMCIEIGQETVNSARLYVLDTDLCSWHQVH